MTSLSKVYKDIPLLAVNTPSIIVAISLACTRDAVINIKQTKKVFLIIVI
jgi:hypothetical protein